MKYDESDGLKIERDRQKPGNSSRYPNSRGKLITADQLTGNKQFFEEIEGTKTLPVTRDDVAHLAGVSSATVSRVFNLTGRVSEDRRKAVLHAAELLNYRPNKSASALRRSGTGIITFLEITKRPRAYYWGSQPNFAWFYAEIIRGVKSSLDRSMFSLNLETASGGDDIRRVARESDGLICYDIDMEEEAIMVASQGIPYVIAHHTRHFHNFCRCSTDNVSGGQIQGAVLAEAGVKRPLYLTGLTDEVPPHADRLAGFLESWKGSGNLTPEILRIVPGEKGGFEAAGKAAELYLSGYCDGGAAVNDATLIGFLNGLIAKGMHAIVDSLPWCGYDAVPFRSLLPYRFASIDLQPASIYRTAAEMLIRIISGNCCSNEANEAVVLPILVS